MLRVQSDRCSWLDNRNGYELWLTGITVHGKVVDGDRDRQHQYEMNKATRNMQREPCDP